MDNNFKNINYDNIDVEQYHLIDIRFSKEQKDYLKKELRKKIARRKSKKNGLVAAVAVALITVILAYNSNSVLANVIPAFNKLYESLGFKSRDVLQSVYIGKTYEENGIKVTLDNLVGTNHVIKVALKVQYSNKWANSDKPLVHFACGFEGKLDTGSFGGTQDIDDNTELSVLNFISQKGFPSKGDFQIKAFSDGFKNPVIWDMKVDFSNDFKETVDKEITMSKNIGVNINQIEGNTLGIIISSNNMLNKLSGYTYYIKVDNKIYPILGGTWNREEGGVATLMENIQYDTIKNSKHIYLVKHSSGEDILKTYTKEESIKYADETEKKLDSLPKVESNGVIYTKEITFNNGNKAEIYNVQRTDGKILIYIKGDDKKQVFNMLSSLYTSTGELVQSIEYNGTGYVAEFDDISNGKVTIKMTADILNWNGDYNEEESELTLK